MPVVIDPHARDRLAERGAREHEVIATVEGGERFPAKFGRAGFRRNFAFGGVWRGRVYAMKQLEVFAVEEDGAWVVSPSSPGSSEERPMRLSYDPRRNVAYIRLRPATAEVETLRVSDEINIDLAPDGTVAGIELLNANEQLQGDGGLLVVSDESQGQHVEVALTAA